MSQENVETVRRCLGFWAERDWSAAPELLDPDVEFDLSRNIFNPAVYRGVSGLQRLISGADDAAHQGDLETKHCAITP
jgi:ketosteroid isomerase-like protein